jgi:hypothetical protein
MPIDKSITNEKRFEAHSLSNQRLNDETEEKNHTNIVIKIMREKIKIKNKLEDIKKI